MRNLFLSVGAAGLALASFAPGARAATDFSNTDLRPTPTGAVTNNGVTAGDWTIEASSGALGDGNSNRLGGAANPQVGTDPDFSVPIFSMGDGTNGRYIDYNYKSAPPDVSGLSGSVTATFDSIFRVRNVNNNNGRGAPILSMSLGNNQAGGTKGVGISINYVNFSSTDDSYHYVLTEYSDDSTTTPLFDIGQFALASTSDHRDSNYEHAILTVTNNGSTSHVSLNWNGSTVYDADVVGLGSVSSRAYAGAGTAIQPNAGNGFGVVWFQSANLSAASVVPEPTSLALLGGGLGLLAMRRRRA